MVGGLTYVLHKFQSFRIQKAQPAQFVLGIMFVQDPTPLGKQKLRNFNQIQCVGLMLWNLGTTIYICETFWCVSNEIRTKPLKIPNNLINCDVMKYSQNSTALKEVQEMVQRRTEEDVPWYFMCRTLSILPIKIIYLNYVQKAGDMLPSRFIARIDQRTRRGSTSRSLACLLRVNMKVIISLNMHSST